MDGMNLDVCGALHPQPVARIVRLKVEGPLHLGHVTGPLAALRCQKDTLLLLDERQMSPGAASQLVLDLMAAGLGPENTRLLCLSRLDSEMQADIAQRLGAETLLRPQLLSPLLLTDAPVQTAAKLSALTLEQALSTLAEVAENIEVVGELRVGLARGDYGVSLVLAMLADRVEAILAPHRQRRALLARRPGIVQGWVMGSLAEIRASLV